jgi:glycosyltransferase involved in cell wall biosynthesis
VVKRYQLSNISFRGHVHQEKVPLYLFAADVLLMPYNSTLRTADRCSPLKMFEYLASGTPVISSDLPVLRTVLQHKINALLISPDSTSELAATISRIRNNSDFAGRIGRKGREDAMQFSWETRARRILDVALERT